MEVTIERILPGGLGLAHAEGKTVMVALAAPGDRLRIQIDRVKGNVSFGRIQEILTPSPNRVEPPCPYFGRCGGCDFQQLSYEAQLAAKLEIIKDCLRRIGSIETIPDFEITPAPNQWHYRSRAQWQYDAIRQRLGYFESGSRRVCDVAACAVLVPELQQMLSSLRERMQDGSLPEDTRDVRALAGNEGVSIALNCVSTPTNRGPQAGSPPGVVDREGSKGRGSSPTVREGSKEQGSSPTVRVGSDSSVEPEEVRKVTRSIHGETYALNAESFFQTNDDLLSALIDAALSGASGEVAVELYCGVGLFTIPLARRFARVIGVEDDTSAADFARVNLANAGLTNAKIANEDVSDWLKENLECGDLSPLSEKRRPIDALEHPDFLLLDPPRTGAESRVITGILGVRPQKICYVSCDPATLARDLKKLISGGYTLDSLAAFDMFPQTHHVETIVRLTG